MNAWELEENLYNWIMYFLLERTIQVRIGVEYSKTYVIDNGTPQGSVCSPVFFNIMIFLVILRVTLEGHYLQMTEQYGKEDVILHVCPKDYKKQ